jgi:TonB family protein
MFKLKYCLLLLLLITVSTITKAQQSPRDEYTTFARFQKDEIFVDYIAEHVKKPDLITADAKGILEITVLVDTTGKASVYRITKKIAPEVDAQFAKAILDAPQFTPANFNGKAVPVYFTIQIGVEVNKAAATMATDASIGKIYNAVEVQPTFPGGQRAFDNFIITHLQYPAEAKQRGVSGRVFVQFVVETDGTLSNLLVLRDPGAGLGPEAIRILKLSPNWKPGMQRGKTLRVQYTVPVNFSLYN